MGERTVLCPKCKGECSHQSFEEGYPVDNPCYFCSTFGYVTPEQALGYLKDVVINCLASTIVIKLSKGEEFGLIAAENGVSPEMYQFNLTWTEEGRLRDQMKDLPDTTWHALAENVIPELYEEVYGSSIAKPPAEPDVPVDPADIPF